VLQCTTAYPTSPEQWGLNVMHELKERFELPVGFSDHSGNIFASLAAASLGAEIFEFHVVFDKRQFGPDTASSITIGQTKVLCEGIAAIKKSRINPVLKAENEKYAALKVMFGKSLAVNKSLPSGYMLTADDLESKKPGDRGIPASEYRSVIGKKLNKKLNKWDFLAYEDLNSEE